MNPVLRDGSFVIAKRVSPADKLTSGHVVVVRSQGKLVIKRILQVNEDRVILTSDNLEYNLKGGIWGTSSRPMIVGVVKGV